MERGVERELRPCSPIPAIGTPRHLLCRSRLPQQLPGIAALGGMEPDADGRRAVERGAERGSLFGAEVAGDAADECGGQLHGYFRPRASIRAQMRSKTASSETKSS